MYLSALPTFMLRNKNTKLVAYGNSMPGAWSGQVGVHVLTAGLITSHSCEFHCSEGATRPCMPLILPRANKACLMLTAGLRALVETDKCFSKRLFV